MSAIWAGPYGHTPYADSRNPRMGICRLKTLIDLICAFDYFVFEIGSESSPKSKENGLKIFLANPRGFLCGGRSSYLDRRFIAKDIWCAKLCPS